MLIRTCLCSALMIAMPAGEQADAQRLTPDMNAVIVGNVADYFGPDHYPAEAIRAKRQGRVIADVGVDSAGDAVSCTIKVSSGTASLDAQTCSIAMANLHFNPATDRQGRPTASTYPLSVRWVLPSSYEEPRLVLDLSSGALDAAREVELSYSADGTLVACRLLSDAFPVKDPRPCGHYKIGEKTGAQWSSNGQRVGTKVVERYSAHVTPTP